MKTITISDETYRKLESIKEGRSFTETIDGLIASSVAVRIDRLVGLSAYANGREDDLDRVVGEIRKRTKARRFEAAPRR